MYASLQAGRAVAAALVVLFHLGGTFAQAKYFGYQPIDGPFAWGDAGVDFFFVLSGFLITTLHRNDFGRPQALGSYVFKRSLRIYPTYWLVCLGVILAAAAVPSLRAALPSDALTMLKALALIPQDPAVVGGTGSPILFVAWSLQYEMLFYLVIGIAILSRAAGLLVLLALSSMQVACGFGNSCQFPQSFLSSPMILLFAIGVACSYAVHSRLRIRKPLLLGVLGMLAFVGFGVFESRYGRHALPIDRSLVYGALASLVIFSMTRAESCGELVLKQRWVGLLGDASYALYLLHIPIISVLCKLAVKTGASSPPALVALYLAIFAICIALAVAFHWFIERRMLAWLRRVLTPRRAAPPAFDERPRREGVQ